MDPVPGQRLPAPVAPSLTGVDNPSLYRMRSGGALLPKNVDGLSVLADVHFARSDTVPVALKVPVSGS